MAIYNPDKWTVVSLSKLNGSGGTEFKILASWYGGFAGSDSWKLSSGITKVVDKDTYYEVHNYSGSIYKCYKEAQGTSMYTQSIFMNWVEEISRKGKDLLVMLDDIQDTGLLLKSDFEKTPDKTTDTNVSSKEPGNLDPSELDF
jgi:hypothetical protein